MSQEELKTSQAWYETIPAKYKFVIMDPDGWDRKNYQYSFHEELITKEEFKMRMANSTCLCSNNFHTATDEDW